MMSSNFKSQIIQFRLQETCCGSQAALQHSEVFPDFLPTFQDTSQIVTCTSMSW